ncbi:MAG: hypothetical protein PHQ23_16825 [Candidatus Wallbacteria bacterium]|nr:hypothetical protein [Candidatus Wallbacteria bacterium]
MKKLRFLVEHNNSLKPVFLISFGNDSSIYLFPYGKKGVFSYGRSTIPENVTAHSFKYNPRENPEKHPKLSIHESGQVHVCSENKQVAGPITISPLQIWSGQHIATVQVDSFSGLASRAKQLKNTTTLKDHVVKCEKGVENGRFAIYCNYSEPTFSTHCPIRLELVRPHLPRVMYFGVSLIASTPLEGEGITIITGWPPESSTSEPMDFLFLRVE